MSSTSHRSLALRVRHRLDRGWDTWRTRGATRFLRDLEPPQPTGTALLVTMTNRSIGGKSYGLLGRRLEMAGLRPVVLTAKTATHAAEVYRLFGIEEIRTVDLEAVRPRPVLSDEAARRVDEPFLLEFTYRGVQIGRSVLNTLIREHKVGAVDFGEPAVRSRLVELLARSAGVVDLVEPIVREIDPDLALFQPDRGYSPVGEVFGICIERGIPAIPVSPSHRDGALVLKRYSADNLLDTPFSLSAASWSTVLDEPWSEDREREILAALVGAYESGSWYSHVYERRDRSHPESAELRRRLEIGPDRPVGVIFPHVLWDAAFFYGSSLFDNYEQWLVETLRAAGRARDVEWVVRLHPAYVSQRRLARLDELADLAQFRRRLGTVPQNVHFVEPDETLSALALFRLADLCVTVQGTVGIEAPCHGVNTLTAGRGRYSERGFTIDPPTREEYLRAVEQAADLEPLAPEAVTLARRFAHALFLRRPWAIDSFEVTMRAPDRLGHPLDRNLHLKVHDAESFLAAPDLGRFTGWVTECDDEDYLEDGPPAAG